MNTVFESYSSAAERFPGRIAVELQRRSGVEALTYRELYALTLKAAGALHRQGLVPDARCAILADNDARWCATYFGILRLGAVAVPLDTAYRPPQVRTILDDSGAVILVISPRYLETARAAIDGMATPPALVLLAGEAEGCAAVDAAPETTDADLPALTRSSADLAVILYTSGTTSDPKGVMLTHGNLLAELRGAFSIVPINEADALLSVLPLFHALAQAANLLIPLTVGARVVFMETINSTEMVRALTERRITAFVVVPQFYYLIHQRVLERVAASPWIARVLFRTLLALNGFARSRLRVNVGRVLFRQVHAAVGPAMRVLVTGGSRFDPRIGRDLFNMGFNIIQAYGLTECSGGGTATRPGDPHIESVGQPVLDVEIRIQVDPNDRSEREYPDGEVLMKGPIVMAGYYNKPEATAEALRDGWLYTGDLGYLDRQGRLYITGRRKEVIVLSSGKNIYPEEIEAVYLASPFIKEICVLGVARPDEPSAERLHAIVVPNLDVMRERRVVNMREVIRFDIEGLSLKLPHHKRVLSFDIWQDELPRTTTRKLKRHAIERAYYAQTAAAADSPQAAEWSDEDHLWASDPHVARVLDHIRTAAKPGVRISPDANLELDLGFDSMERVELLAELEQAIGVDLPEEAAQRIYTVRDLADALRPVGGEAAAGERVDPWARVFTEEVSDPAIEGILRPRPVYTPLAFVIIKTWHAAARLFMGLRVSGRPNIPAEGAYLISPNHQSYLDAFLLIGTLPYRTFRRLFFVGASEYFETRFKRWLAGLINVVPVDPDANLVRAMQAGAFGLRHGRVLVLFPEGERSPDGTVRTFKKGASILAAHLRVPIVPVAIHGVFELWPRGKGIQWGHVLPFTKPRPHIAFGQPVSLQTAGLEATPVTPDHYTRLTAELRAAVVALWTALARPPRS